MSSLVLLVAAGGIEPWRRASEPGLPGGSAGLAVWSEARAGGPVSQPSYRSPVNTVSLPGRGSGWSAGGGMVVLCYGDSLTAGYSPQPARPARFHPYGELLHPPARTAAHSGFTTEQMVAAANQVNTHSTQKDRG